MGRMSDSADIVVKLRMVRKADLAEPARIALEQLDTQWGPSEISDVATRFLARVFPGPHGQPNENRAGD